MKSRNKIISLILLFWMLLVIIILLASGSIFITGFAKLEKNLANETTKRVAHIFLSNLNHIYAQNLDQAYWNDAYQYMEDKNPKFIKENYKDSFFVDNAINYLIFVDNQGEIVHSDKFNLKSEKHEPVEEDILDFFKKNALKILNNQNKYYQIEPQPSGIVGLFKEKDQGTDFYVLNYIKDSDDTKPERGVLIFGKDLSDDYFNTLSKNLNYKIQLISNEDVLNSSDGEKVFKILENESIYSYALDKNTYLSFFLLKDINNKPIGALRIELSRTLYNEGKNSIIKGQILLVVFSILGASGMTTLVYFFFKKQNLITLSFQRFVPRQLIDLLQKKDILDVYLGDSSKRTLSVLFLDIRNFTTISEGLSPHENFSFINTLLKEFAPVISAHNGFIDKYIGDAIMAIFSNEATSADDALQSASGILKELEKLNKQGVLKTTSPVKIGIGINTGEAMLGILGAEGRLEGTVISDMVNTASRIQTLTKSYSYDILISEECYQSLKHPEMYHIEYVDAVLMKGKTKKVPVYGVIPQKAPGEVFEE